MIELVDPREILNAALQLRWPCKKKFFSQTPNLQSEIHFKGTNKYRVHQYSFVFGSAKCKQKTVQ